MTTAINLYTQHTPSTEMNCDTHTGRHTETCLFFIKTERSQHNILIVQL